MFTNRDLKRLIIPLIIEQILAVTVGMADTMMVSSAGEAATSGVSLVDMINNLLINYMQKRRSIAMYKSVGLSNRQNVKITLIEGFYVGLIGAALAVLFLIWKYRQSSL